MSEGLLVNLFLIVLMAVGIWIGWIARQESARLRSSRLTRGVSRPSSDTGEKV